MEEAAIKYFFALCSLSAPVACDEKSKFSETKYAETEAEIICAGKYDDAYMGLPSKYRNHAPKMLKFPQT